jgi:glutamine synthetase
MVGSRRQAANLEVKAMDAAANVYLALGAIVAAGIDGLEREAALPEPVTVDPASISPAKRRSAGVRRLPSSLGEAIRELEESSLLREAMGDVLFEAFLATRRGEEAAFGTMDREKAVAAHRWRY